MKILFATLLITAMLLPSSDGKFDKDTCTCKGKQLYGRVKIVDFNPDFKVKIVESMEDLKVTVRTGVTSRCGEWTFTDGAADFTIQYVDFNPDFTIKLINYP
jgi:hypothetical protein